VSAVRFRLLPVILLALGAFLAFKTLEILRRGDMAAVGVALAAGPPPAARPPSGGPPPDGPGAVTHERPAEAPIPSRPSAEGALAERLVERRRQLDERAREIDQREALLRAAERRLEERVDELRRLEQRSEQSSQQREEQQTQQMRALVTMYENMRAAEAARIFERLERDVLISVATRMNPRRMSEILAAMQPDAAQRLTTALARRGTPAPTTATPTAAPGSRELQRIDQPRGPS
jgi:flagellar motility protein MotE (MotC chaperone)